MDQKKRTYISIGLAAIVAMIALIVAYATGGSSLPVATSNDAASTDTAGAQTQTEPQATGMMDAPVVDMPKKMMSPYKDGSYTAIGTYDSPGGLDQLTVSLTLKAGIVTAAQVVSGANDRESARYQQRFISGYTPYVVGKSIDSIRLAAVSGSSLTPVGFNNALAKIKAQAAQS